MLCQCLSTGKTLCVFTTDSVLYHLHICRVTHCRQNLSYYKIPWKQRQIKILWKHIFVGYAAQQIDTHSVTPEVKQPSRGVDSIHRQWVEALYIFQYFTVSILWNFCSAVLHTNIHNIIAYPLRATGGLEPIPADTGQQRGWGWVAPWIGCNDRLEEDFLYGRWPTPNSKSQQQWIQVYKVHTVVFKQLVGCLDSNNCYLQLHVFWLLYKFWPRCILAWCRGFSIVQSITNCHTMN